MGYRPQRTVYKLRFEDPEMGGLVVRANGLSVGELIEVGRLKAEADAGADALDELLHVFAGKLVSWNLEGEDGTEVEPSFEELAKLEPAFTLALLDAWMTAVAGVSVPLGQSLPGGSPSALASLPMEALSASQAS